MLGSQSLTWPVSLAILKTWSGVALMTISQGRSCRDMGVRVVDWGGVFQTGWGRRYKKTTRAWCGEVIATAPVAPAGRCHGRSDEPRSWNRDAGPRDPRR